MIARYISLDMDNNGFLDEDEIKTLFIRELDKLYASGSLQGDAVERAEEMERMREHVFNEVDKNKDRLIRYMRILRPLRVFLIFFLQLSTTLFIGGHN